MKSARTPAVVLALLYAAFLADLWLSAPQLPGHVATHFDAAGHPNGWMTRAGHLRFMAGFGLALPLLLAGLGHAVRFVPAALVNLPNRDYWLAPERRAATCDRLFAQMLWLACLMLVFAASVHHLILAANRATPPRLPAPEMLLAAAAFLAAVGAWVVALLRMFRKPA